MLSYTKRNCVLYSQTTFANHHGLETTSFLFMDKLPTHSSSDIQLVSTLQYFYSVLASFLLSFPQNSDFSLHSSTFILNGFSLEYEQSHWFISTSKEKWYFSHFVKNILCLYKVLQEM